MEWDSTRASSFFPPGRKNSPQAKPVGSKPPTNAKKKLYSSDQNQQIGLGPGSCGFPTGWGGPRSPERLGEWGPGKGPPDGRMGRDSGESSDRAGGIGEPYGPNDLTNRKNRFGATEGLC